MPLSNSYFPSALADIYARGLDISSDNPWMLAQSVFPRAQVANPSITMDSLVGDARNYLQGVRTSDIASQPAGGQPSSEIFTPGGPVPDMGSMSGAPAGTPGGQGLTVGQSLAAADQGGMVPGGFGSPFGNALTGASLLGMPPSAASLFNLSNWGMGTLAGQNTLPGTQTAVTSPQGRAALDADAVFGMGSLGDQAAGPSSAVQALTSLLSSFSPIPASPLGANTPGFGLSPFSLGTPFGMPAFGGLVGAKGSQTAPEGLTGLVDEAGNPAGAATGNAPANSTNFGDSPSNTANAPTAITDPSTGQVMGVADGGGPTGGTPGGAPGGAPAGSAGAGGTTGGAGEMRRGGIVKNTRKGSGDNEPRRLTAGEFVVNKNATGKNRLLLEALNAMTPPDGAGLDALIDRAKEFWNV